MKKNYRGICLIGAGRAGMIHARNFQRSVPGFRIVSVADPVEEAAASACRELEIEKYLRLRGRISVFLSNAED